MRSQRVLPLRRTCRTASTRTRPPWIRPSFLLAISVRPRRRTATRRPPIVTLAERSRAPRGSVKRTVTRRDEDLALHPTSVAAAWQPRRVVEREGALPGVVAPPAGRARDRARVRAHERVEDGHAQVSRRGRRLAAVNDDGSRTVAAVLQ